MGKTIKNIYIIYNYHHCHNYYYYYNIIKYFANIMNIVDSSLSPLDDDNNDELFLWYS